MKKNKIYDEEFELVEKKHKFFDHNTVAWIEKKVDENKFDEAIFLYNEYIQNYPKDIVAKSLYIDILIKQGNFEEAEAIFNEIEINEKVPFSVQGLFTLIKAKLLCCEAKYEECLVFVENNLELISNYVELDLFLPFLRKRLNKLEKNDFQKTGYLVNQIVDYDEDKCIEHILKHKYDSDHVCQFTKNFPLEEMYYKLRKNMPKENRIYNSTIDYCIIFKYDDCGKIDNKKVDYFMVVVINGTNDIITMYPYANTEKLNCIDLTPTIDYGEKVLVKRLSQIEKFNKKYNN